MMILGVITLSKKGAYYEYTVMNIFEENGYATVRTVGSGAGTKKPKPDIVVSNGNNTYAIEVKQRNDEVLYITTTQVQELKKFSSVFGATPLIVFKFGRRPFYVVTVDSLHRKSSKNYKITVADATTELNTFISRNM